MLQKSVKFQQRRRDLNQKIQQIEVLRKQIDEKLKEQEPRRIQPQVLGRIPEYEFFVPFKHGWRKCKSHDKNSTFEHMMDNLLGKSGEWEGKMLNIMDQIQDVETKFYSSVQKALREQIEKITSRIKRLIEEECGPYKRKQTSRVETNYATAMRFYSHLLLGNILRKLMEMGNDCFQFYVDVYRLRQSQILKRTFNITSQRNDSR
ncbi:unnamed protein product [Paramecium octaurelia]|uniref:Uncharacterized protein n=1 Tax=Paramecium octaurelia TaxID=43137 RepID=A0A8S1W4U8_PAROT|nr:unnamed protein product [Paramecium octaurelia]